VRRTEIWTAAAGSGYAGKPRPVVILQDDRFDALESVTVCAFTTDPTEAPLIRLAVEPDEGNALRERCSLMVRQDHDDPALEARRAHGAPG
jgi:mRNA interferase MazF